LGNQKAAKITKGLTLAAGRGNDEVRPFVPFAIFCADVPQIIVLVVVVVLVVGRLLRAISGDRRSGGAMQPSRYSAHATEQTADDDDDDDEDDEDDLGTGDFS
jgi:hypothetical protein